VIRGGLTGARCRGASRGWGCKCGVAASFDWGKSCRTGDCRFHVTLDNSTGPLPAQMLGFYDMPFNAP